MYFATLKKKHKGWETTTLISWLWTKLLVNGIPSGPDKNAWHHHTLWCPVTPVTEIKVWRKGTFTIFFLWHWESIKGSSGHLYPRKRNSQAEKKQEQLTCISQIHQLSPTAHLSWTDPFAGPSQLLTYNFVSRVAERRKGTFYLLSVSSVVHLWPLAVPIEGSKFLSTGEFPDIFSGEQGWKA